MFGSLQANARNRLLSQTDDLLKNNEAYTAGLPARELPAAPAKKVAVLSCMDARIDLYGAFGLEVGDAHIIRNAGGIVTDDEIRSLAISQHMLGTEEVIVVQHTDCGLLGFTDDEFAQLLEEHAGQRPEWAAGTFSELEESVRAACAMIRTSPFIPRTDSVRGFVYDVGSGRLTEIT